MKFAAAAAVLCLWLALGKATVRGKRQQHVFKLLKADLEPLAGRVCVHWKGPGTGRLTAGSEWSAMTNSLIIA